MSAIASYIASLTDKTFNGIVEHFTSLGVYIQDFDKFYMLVAPQGQDYSTISEELRNVISQAVGTIFEKETNRLICFGFPKTQEITLGSASKSVEGPIEAHEYTYGTLIRAYHNGKKWQISTNGTSDAYASYWISKRSIGDLFDDCICRIYKVSTSFSVSPLIRYMKPGMTYMFILQHPEMHLENVGKPFFYHIGTFDNSKMVYDYSVRVDRIPQPQSFSFPSYDEMISSLDSVTGFVFFPKNSVDSQSPRYKILNRNIKAKIDLMGRTSNLYLRYLECKAEKKEDDLLKNFPSMRSYSSWVEKSLQEISKIVTNNYIEKFVRRQFDLPINFYLRPIISGLRESRVYVNPASVYDYLSSQHPKRINFILNGLEYINTGDVNLVQVQEPQQVQDFTEEELQELEEAVKNEEYRRAMEDKTTEEFLKTLDEPEMEDFLTPRFSKVLEMEIFINHEEIGFHPYDIQKILGIMFDNSYFDLALAYDDDAYLIPLVHSAIETYLMNM